MELGIWVANQRKRASQNKLRADRKEILQKLGFSWTVNVVRHTGSRTGIIINHTCSSSNKKKQEICQKKNSKANSKSSLNTNTSSKPSPKTSHSLLTKHDVKWNSMMEKLKAYKRQHGNCEVPYNYLEDTELGMWVSTQRRVYNKNTFMYGERKEMHQPRKQLLIAVGLCFSFSESASASSCDLLPSTSTSTSTQGTSEGKYYAVRKRSAEGDDSFIDGDHLDDDGSTSSDEVSMAVSDRMTTFSI